MFSTEDSKEPEAPRADQMSFLPNAAECAALENASSAMASRNPKTNSSEKPTEVSVIGERQFKEPGLFPPPKTKGLDQPREIILRSDDADVQRSIKVLGNNVTSGYTSDTLNVIAVINDMWVEQGSHPEGWVTGSYAEVVRRLNLPADNPTRNRKKVKMELDRLRRCVLIFSHFTVSAEIKHNHEITYFTEYSYIEDRRNPAQNFFKAQLHKLVLSNLQTGYIASLPLRALLQLQEDKSKPVLLRVDSVLATMERIELSASTILEMLLLQDSDWYAKPSVRKRLLDTIREDLLGKELSSGWTIACELTPTAQGDDFKLVFTRGIRTEYKPRAPRQIVNTDAVVVQQLADAMTNAVGERGKEQLYTLLAKSYPEDLIHRAIAEFKADKPATTRNNGAFFAKILSRIVTEMGYAWIK